MEPGTLRHRITIQALTPSQDAGTGIVTPTWSTFAATWADVQPLSAREFVVAANSQSVVVKRIVIRYRPGVLPSMRILHGTQTYNIEGVLPDPKSGKEYLTLPVSEVVNG